MIRNYLEKTYLATSVNRGAPGRGSKWFAHLPIPKKLRYISLHYAHFITNVTISWGGGVVETNFQLLMLSPNLLKSQIPMSGWGGGGCGNQFPTLILSPNLLKSKKKFYKGVCWKLSKFSGKKVPGIGFGLWVPSGSRITRTTMKLIQILIANGKSQINLSAVFMKSMSETIPCLQAAAHWSCSCRRNSHAEGRA